MADEWRETTLGEVTDFLSGGTPSKDRPDYWVGSVPWVSAKDMKRFRLDDSEDHVSEDAVANGTKLVPAGSVLLLARGMTLLNDLPICVISEPMTFNQDVKALRPKPHVRSDYLPYLLLGNKGRLLSLVDLAGHGTGRLNSDELKALDVALPPLPEQRAIAHILGTLDDKIELNRRMNETLEAMARALFKSWFVDFDPVRAKAEGRDPGLPKPLTDLFPDSFEDSELGEIPKGWAVVDLELMAFIQGGKQLPTDKCQPQGTHQVFGANGIMGYTEQTTHEGFVIAFGRVGAYCGSIHWTYRGAWINNNASAVVPRRWPEFVLQSMLNVDFTSIRTGSAQPFIPNGALAVVPVLRPGERVLDAYCSVVRSLRLNQCGREEESRTLAALRDTLLPKLISGELRVKDAERFVGRAT